MKVKLFAIPAREPGPGEEELNRFLAGKRVVSLDHHLAGEPSGPFWAFCVTYVEAAESTPEIRRGKIDYREVLPAAEFAVFVRLRNLRKQLAQEEGVPPYALFTNEELATMVRQQVRSLEAMAAIPGVGQARLEKYGAAFLEILASPDPPPKRNDNLGFRLARAQPWAGRPAPDPTLAGSACKSERRKRQDRRCASRAAEAPAKAHRRGLVRQVPYA